ncbi:folate family ECF transporter S component [Clostridium lacusfryxellense]|uniref:folate family ECF transporter S component n=1 Tax=Clostridium lacusfryxellense TaxID=205328 RepID=UPI001C0B5C25|nr:folate family ECF transporter S component [Clostridium lacusfryxellense]MBU3114513.1 folate family ECF transporter S component [Clostridium lacusfryxellense]
MKNTRIFIFMGLLLSIEIVLTRFFAIQTPIVRIGFGFIPIAIASVMFGPVLGGITAAFSDILGMMLFPKGIYFPGFTLSALLSGIIYGISLYKKPKTMLRIIIAVSIILIFVDLGLNTYWLSIITGKGIVALFVPRLIKSIIMLPIQSLLIYSCLKFIPQKKLEIYNLYPLSKLIK